MKIIVTGATGFLGGEVARRYAASGDEVIGLGRNRASGEQLERDGIRFVAADLALAAGDWTAAFDGADLVVHCAALASLRGTDDMFEAANVTATANVLRACEEAAVPRLVHMSSPSIYQTGASRVGIKESDPIGPTFTSVYAATKWEAEKLVLGAHERGLGTVMLRPRAVYGAGDTSIVPRIVRALRSGRMKVIGDGENLVDVSYVDNVVDATLAAARADTRGEAYNITNGEPIRIWDFVRRIAEALELPPPRGQVSIRFARNFAGVLEDAYRVLLPTREAPVTRYGVDSLSLTMTMDIGRARAELGYEPRVSTDEGLARVLDHYRAHGVPEVS